MSNHIRLKLRLHGRTELSLLVSKHGDPNQAVWLRKSKLVGEPVVDGDSVELTMPETLARGERLA